MFVPLDPPVHPHLLLALLRWIGLGIAAPFLLVALLAALVTVVLDFTWFRFHASLTGAPHPKGLWEF
jgi:hypothetical protein